MLRRARRRTGREVIDLGPARRILIYGVTGSGKTTFAAELGRRTGIAWHEVDQLTWEPGWTPVPDGEQRRRITELCAGDSWVLDSAYSRWVDAVTDRVQFVVGLDFPRWVSFARLLRRTAFRIFTQQQICNGNVETFRGTFDQESILRWHFRSFKRKRIRLRAWAAGEIAVPVVLLRSPGQARRWLTRLPDPRR